MSFFNKKNEDVKNYLEGYDFEVGDDVVMRQFTNVGVILELSPTEKKGVLVSWVYSGGKDGVGAVHSIWEYPHMVCERPTEEEEAEEKYEKRK